jgi:hypothetical protein
MNAVRKSTGKLPMERRTKMTRREILSTVLHTAVVITIYFGLLYLPTGTV